MPELADISLADILAARERIVGAAVRTPLIRLNVENGPAEIYLKLENLQPIGSFKIRGASNAMALASKADLARGVLTASAGNMAQGVAWNARRLGIASTAIVPEHAPQTKLDAITRLGGKFIKAPFDAWWQVMLTRQYDGAEGFFVHPVSDPAVIAGNGTIGVEIFEDLPDVDAVVVPYGGGGLSTGIACALRELKPGTRVYASEVATAAAFSAALKNGEPTQIEYQSSFVDGIGSARVLTDMWGLARDLLADSLVVSVADVASAVRVLVERARVVAEGAAATSVAAALAGMAGSGKVVCVVSGGNIDLTRLAKILQGD